MLAEVVDAVAGVDTHRDTHQVEIAHPTGTPIATISDDSTGFAELLGWIFDHAPGPRLAVSIEGTRSYGVGLARAVAAAGLMVIECDQPHRKARRGKGKSDPIDAHLAVLSALRCDADRLPTPRADGDREALRILLGARHDLTTAHTAQTNRLRALLLGGDDTDRQTARGALSDTVLAALVRRRSPRDADRAQAVRHGELRRLAVAVREGGRALKANRDQLAAIVDDLAPGLTDRRGVGPVSAAQAIISFSHPGRCRSDAAFAAPAGTNPLEASSGRTTRHRLNRGGDRALNRAVHTIAVTRMRCCERTRAYVARRTAQGTTSREIRRCLKRYITRELYPRPDHHHDHRDEPRDEPRRCLTPRRVTISRRHPPAGCAAARCAVSISSVTDGSHVIDRHHTRTRRARHRGHLPATMPTVTRMNPPAPSLPGPSPS
ncbi:MAG: transposase [Actinobacteria bacterium]|nr:transposase [Actinomycetota bacterium]